MTALAVRRLFASAEPLVRSITSVEGGPATRPAFTPPPAAPDPVDSSEELQRAWAERESDLEAAMDAYVEALGKLAEKAQQLEGRLATEAVELGLTIARELLERELSVDREGLVNGISDALTSLRGTATQLVARLSPSDAAHMQGKETIDQDNLEIVADPSITIGGFIIEADDHILEATTDSRLEAVRQALLGLTPATENNAQ